MKTIIGLILLYIFLTSAQENPTVATFEKDNSPLKALVFLSDECPCSKSHIAHLNRMAKEGLKIYGVVSEPLNDSMSEARKKQLIEYFAKSGFEFPILQDPSQSLVKKYNALKTPHATMFQKTAQGYHVVYEGGVTNQKKFEKSTVRYLEENWREIQAGRSVKYKNGHSLGCYIRRI